MENNYEFNLDDVGLYLNGNLVLEASAGTGKTFSIQKMVKNLVKNKVDINKVLIVTYTEKATGELKNRIREELSKDVASNDLDNLNIYTIHSFCQNAIREFGLDANQPLALNVIDEKNKLGEFFDAYVRENEEIKNLISIACCIDSSFKVNSDALNAKPLKKRMIDVLLKYYLNKKGKVDFSIISLQKLEKKEEEFFQILKNHGLSYDSLYNNMEVFKTSFDVLFNTNDPKILWIANCYKNLLNNKEIPTSRIDFWKINDLNSNETAAFEVLKQYHDSIIQNDSYADYLEGHQDIKNSLETLRNSNNFIANYIADSAKKEKNKFKIGKIITLSEKDGYSEEVLDAIQNLLLIFSTLKALSWHKFIIYSFLDKFYMDWQKYKQENKMQTYNDMLRTIREELVNGNEAFKNKLKEKYQYAIIDEFQDTNQLQFDTFKSIFLEDNDHHMIVVGDPKQSIYSFQGADLNVYQKACDELIQFHGAKKRMLLTNYRSTDKMIDACNNFFKSHKDEDNQIKYFFAGQEFYSSSSTGKQNATYNGQETEAIWIASPNNYPIQPKDYATLICKFILDACSKMQNGDTKLQVYDKKRNALRSVSFRDFTILCKQRSETDDLVYLLSKKGIPFVRYKDNGLLKSNECFHWATIFDALVEVDFTGGRRKTLRRALASKFFGYTLEELNSSYFNHDDIDEVRLINKWKEMAKNKEWEKLIESIMLDSNLYNNLKELDKLQSYTLYKQLGDYCLSYLYGNHTLEDLAYKLKNNPSEDEDDEDSGIVEIGTDFDAVKIMTIHAAKGLQYPVVISVAGWKNPISSCSYIYHDVEYLQEDLEEGETQSNQNVVTNVRKISFEHNDDVDADIDAEYRRLLYVAYTRAESLMIIPYYNLENSACDEIKWQRDWTRDMIYSLKYKKIGFSSFNGVANVDDILTHNADDTSYQYDQIEGLSEKKSYKSSYSSLSHGEVIKEEEYDDEPVDLENPINNDFNLTEYDMNACQMKSNVDSSIPHEAYDGIPKGSTIGTALHEIFERIDFTDYKHNLDEIIKERLIANRIKVMDKTLDYIRKMIDNVLNALLPELDGTSFKLSEISMDNRKAEIEFNFNLKEDFFKNYCNGFIDLLFRRGNKYYILDWKSDTLNDEFLSYSDLSELKKHTDKLYSIQRVLYSYCLIKWLEPLLNKNEEEIFKNYFGGIYYVYIRGCNMKTGNGIYAQKWNSYKELENAFNMIIKKKIGW